MSQLSSPPRTLVLCFDGTGNKFGENSNVVRFFHALNKDAPTEQLVYYQAGIGTYNQRHFFTRTASIVASTLDQAVALHLDDHVKEGYKFLMQNYRQGDKVCLFGFSRGAYTARVLAGMLYKVGILPPFNDQQLDFAFSIYQSTAANSYKLAKEFKDTFANPIMVEFVGVWDTVSSIGIIPRTLPYSSANYGIKTFRHALALDEHRARFRPNIWSEPTLEPEELVDEPDLKPIDPSPAGRDEWVYEPPVRDIADVKEVWFAGCHADVGGGSHSDSIKDSLSGIPLRWMIKECFVAQTGIKFDRAYLEKLGLNPDALDSDPLDVSTTNDAITPGLGVPSGDFSIPDPLSTHFSNAISGAISTVSDAFSAALPDITSGALTMASHHIPGVVIALRHIRDHADATAQIFDQLVHVKPWWILEFIPMLSTYQLEDGSWTRQRIRNFGRGRYIPFYDNQIMVHVSVAERIKNKKADGVPYEPLAFNWDHTFKSGMIKWVN